MTQQNENLSAFVDGELQDSKIISDIKNDAELSEKWQRYHLIRQGLRKELPEAASFDISASFAAALEDEPVVLAPKRRWQSLPVVASVIPFVRQGGQLAVAASVAVAMVLGVQQLNQPETVQPLDSSSPFTFPGIQGGLSPVSLEKTNAVPRDHVLEQLRMSNAYLSDHRHQLRIRANQQQDESAFKDEEQQQQSSSEQPE